MSTTGMTTIQNSLSQEYIEMLHVDDYEDQLNRVHNLRVFHIWNTAGVGSRIAEYTARYYDIKPYVTYMSKYDPYNLCETNKHTDIIDTGYKKFHYKIITNALNSWNIFHVHSLHRYMPLLKLMKPKTPRVLHYHGTRIRDKWEEHKKWWKHATQIVVSTPDLLEGAPEGVKYIPNTYDDILFNRLNHFDKLQGRALTCKHYADKEAEQYARDYDLTLDYHDRWTNPLTHSQFALLLSKYQYYIDVKRQTPPNDKNLLEALSLTGIEALACGCIVINYNGDMITEIPDKFKPENVALEWVKLYLGVLQ